MPFLKSCCSEPGESQSCSVSQESHSAGGRLSHNRLLMGGGGICHTAAKRFFLSGGVLFLFQAAKKKKKVQRRLDVKNSAAGSFRRQDVRSPSLPHSTWELSCMQAREFAMRRGAVALISIPLVFHGEFHSKCTLNSLTASLVKTTTVTTLAR